MISKIKTRSFLIGRPVAVGATLATAVACVLLVVKVAMEDGTYDPVLHSTTEFEPFFMAFGTIVFAFGGHPAFPTFQTDMKKPGDFKWAVLLGYLGKQILRDGYTETHIND